MHHLALWAVALSVVVSVASPLSRQRASVAHPSKRGRSIEPQNLGGDGNARETTLLKRGFLRGQPGTPMEDAEWVFDDTYDECMEYTFSWVRLYSGSQLSIPNIASSHTSSYKEGDSLRQSQYQREVLRGRRFYDDFPRYWEDCEEACRRDNPDTAPDNVPLAPTEEQLKDRHFRPEVGRISIRAYLERLYQGPAAQHPGSGKSKSTDGRDGFNLALDWRREFTAYFKHLRSAPAGSLFGGSWRPGRPIFKPI